MATPPHPRCSHQTDGIRLTRAGAAIRAPGAEAYCGTAAVLDFLSTTDVGRRVPAEEDDAVSAVSELEVREWQDEQGAGAGEAGAGGTPLFLPTPDFMASAGTA